MSRTYCLSGELRRNAEQLNSAQVEVVCGNRADAVEEIHGPVEQDRIPVLPLAVLHRCRRSD